tara:strand:+ start:251 stop:397 length:147 start_codon:yes stop_codon:yes gene_type:complete
LESEFTLETVGTGVGLVLVRSLTAAVHGRVNVVNRDSGTEFAITIVGD